MEKVAVFVFRRDHRVHDNTTLIEVLKRANENDWKVLTAFIFNPKQIDPDQNEYYSSNCTQFMVESLRDLESQLQKEQGKMYYFHGTDHQIFDELSESFDLKLIASNKDITPFALRRDEHVQAWCDRKGIEFLNMEDYTMFPIEQVRTNQGKPFEIYTPFYRRAIRIPVPDPHGIPEIHTGFVKDPLDHEVTDIEKYYAFNEFLEQKGGREKALEILEKIRAGGFRKFKKEHDFPIKDATTKLSAYLKFGCVSVREAFKVMKDSAGKASLLVGQLYYRDFYYNVAYHFPEILKGQVGEKSTPMHGRYEKAEWNEDQEQLEKWKTGNTGFPIVDAAMRCLNKTGWLHGRLRLMAAMFLVRDLDIDWRAGEKYFATKLVDYDPPSNSQGWCWVLSQRRKFNPYKVTGKYDDRCEFIRKWVPELDDITVLELICWWEKHADHPDLDYPKPMVDIQGYRVKFKTYIPDYVRPKDPNYKKTPKKSKYGLNKNKEKYDKNKERNKLLKQQAGGTTPPQQDVQRPTENVPLQTWTQPPPPPPPRRHTDDNPQPRQFSHTQNRNFQAPNPQSRFPQQNDRPLRPQQQTAFAPRPFPKPQSKFPGQPTGERIYPRAPVPQPQPIQSRDPQNDRPPRPQQQPGERIYPRAPAPCPQPRPADVPDTPVAADTDEKPKKKTPKFPSFILPDPKYFRPQNNDAL